MRSLTSSFAAMPISAHEPHGQSGRGGYDCWGGASWKGCTCSSGTARLTGQTFDDSNGNVYYEYTCCDGDTNVGVECGIYVAPVSIG